ncbi:hypothetical protein Alches_12060 [Alicyclobacillus hesperidum subsp. aegles]|nr:hypothetical protein Alches_12060 [Alicyclobacillus hesperidum subsp. aegles]
MFPNPHLLALPLFHLLTTVSVYADLVFATVSSVTVTDAHVKLEQFVTTPLLRIKV